MAKKGKQVDDFDLDSFKLLKRPELESYLKVSKSIVDSRFYNTNIRTVEEIGSTM